MLKGRLSPDQADLEAAEKMEGVKVGQGDALFIRRGESSAPGIDGGPQCRARLHAGVSEWMLFDNCDLEALADAAAARKRWDFLLTAAPLPVKGATGSEINPIARF